MPRRKRDRTAYYIKNKERIDKQNAEYYKNNKAACNKRSKQWVENNPDRTKLYLQKWHQENKDRRREARRIRRSIKKKTDPLFKCVESARDLIRKSFRRRGWKKSTKSQIVLGCTFDELLSHLILSALRNYGYWVNQELVIDHIIPLSQAKTEADVIKLCHYTNLQWLTKEDNLKKGAKMNWGKNNENHT